MIRRTILASALAAIALWTIPVARAAPAQSATEAKLQDHVTWVVQCLQRINSIKAGMTRADLLKLFTTEGGIQTGRTFVFRDCPYFKVTVEWEPTGLVPTGPTLAERSALIDGLPGDVIQSISRPYIQGMIIN